MTDRVHACSAGFLILHGEESFPIESPLCMILAALYMDSGNGKETQFWKGETQRNVLQNFIF
jgi:hypothetical protein